jgi:hypothetical protein
MSLVRVWTNVGQKKPKALLAKIFSSAEGPVYTIRYLTDEGGIYKYEDETYEVDDDSVAEWIGVDDEEDIGYTRVDEGTWVKEDHDSDYVPESSEDETEDDEDDPTDDEEEAEDEEDYGGEEPEENDDYE